MDIDDLLEQSQCLTARPLKRISTDDRPMRPAEVYLSHVLEQRLVVAHRSAREQHDPPAAERCLHHVRDPVLELLEVSLRICRLRFRLSDVSRWRFHLEDVGAKKG